MATFSKVNLSGGTDGIPFDVVATASPGTLIHTADATAIDEIWLYAYNNGGASQTLSLEIGTLSAGLVMNQSIAPASGLILVLPGTVLTNSAVLRAFASAANDISVIGWVNRITP